MSGTGTTAAANAPKTLEDRLKDLLKEVQWGDPMETLRKELAKANKNLAKERRKTDLTRARMLCRKHKITATDLKGSLAE